MHMHIRVYIQKCHYSYHHPELQLSCLIGFDLRDPLNEKIL